MSFACRFSFANVEEELKKRVDLGYNQHLVVGEISDGKTSFYHAGDFLFSPENTLFEIGSITKLFTAHLALILEAEGLFNLGDSVASYLPSWIEIDPKMQIHHLITHTSGIKDPDSENYVHPRTGNTVRAAEFTIAELYTYLKKEHPSPVNKPLYSNLGYGLLGYILEKVSGKPYERILKDKLLAPLQMESTYVNVSQSTKNRLVQGTNMGKSAPYWNLSHLPGFASLKSTAKDLASYLDALFSTKNSPLNKEIIAKLCAPAFDLEIPGVVSTYGLTIDKRFDGEFYAAAGTTLGFSSFIGFDIKRKKGIILLTDASSVDSLGHHFLNSNFPLQKLYRTCETSKKELALYEGTYSNNELAISVIAKEDCLEFHVKGEPLMIEFWPMDRKTFFSRYLNGENTTVKFNLGREKQKELSLFSNGQLSISLQSPE